jgi:hypothetical protein
VLIGYGRIGHEVAERAAGIKCRVLAANRSPVADPTPAETVFPLAELDRMLPRCDAVLVACALAPETRGLIDARRLALIPAVALPVAPWQGAVTSPALRSLSAGQPGCKSARSFNGTDGALRTSARF